uniref:Tf2-1-like SH3-like domain-containing protein n=1 Tax=Tanacetum cinerariifolium TaxID=118510 RepID=A0A6L2NWS1_TANCI|nr:hypothetical protein [Tanacetum cinerariifolium]
MEETMLELVEVCRQKELYCTHDNVDGLIESALNFKLLSINLNSQRQDKEKQEVKNVVEQPAERRTQPEYSLSVGYKHLNTTPETKPDEIINSGVKELVPIPNEYEVTSEDKRECDVLVCEDFSTIDVCEDHSEILSDSNNDDISSDDDAFEDIEYVEASLPVSELVSLEEENDVHQEEEESMQEALRARLDMSTTYHPQTDVMPFGLTNTQAVFTDLMNRVCRPYLDSKIEAVKNWKAPRTLTENCKILNLGEEQELAFQTLKDKLYNVLVLALPDGMEDLVSMQEALRARLDMSTTYHPQPDSQCEHTIQTLEDMLRAVRCTPFEALYGRKCHSLIMWAEVEGGQLIGPELVQETTEKISQIKDRLKAARDRQKKGKLTPRFVGPFEIIEKLGPVAYRLDLPEELSGVYDTFHVSNLKKCLADLTLQVHLDEIRVDAKLNFVEEPVKILEREFKKLKRSRIDIVKVRWNSERSPKSTWERIGSRGALTTLVLSSDDSEVSWKF